MSVKCLVVVREIFTCNESKHDDQKLLLESISSYNKPFFEDGVGHHIQIIDNQLAFGGDGHESRDICNVTELIQSAGQQQYKDFLNTHFSSYAPKIIKEVLSSLLQNGRDIQQI